MIQAPLNSFSAVLWDCDGVLIDSEVLACSACVNILNAHGIAISLDEYIEKFMGKNLAQILEETSFNGIFPTERLKERQRALFEKDLRGMSGILQVLNSITRPMAVASGSAMARLEHTLSLTGLLSYFQGHVYSSESVEKGKPAPDVFLLAAEKLGVAPRDCIVIEDSPHGIAAAKAAGMTVYAFTGGSHMTPAIHEKILLAEPHAIFNDMRDLLPYAKVA